MDKLYTIQEVATKLNVSDKTLRRWEEAGKFTPSRTLGNQRRYSIEDLQILDAIKHGTFAEQKDLLTIDQAGKLCGVSPTTILRWEEAGKIHPFITSGNTYYPRQKLIEKMEELKKIYVEPTLEPVPAPLGSDLKRSVQPQEAPNMESQTLQDNRKPKLTPLDTMTRSSSPLPFNIYLTQALITLILLISYHLLFNQPSAPVSPQTGSVQGASTVVTPDPRLDDLIIKFQDHLQVEMLKDAKPSPPSTTKLDNATLISGTSTLPKSKDRITISADKLTPTTPITLTFTSDYAPAKKYWVEPGEGSFTLVTDFPVGTDSTFNYSYLGSTIAPTPSPTPSTTLTPISTPSATKR